VFAADENPPFGSRPGSSHAARDACDNLRRSSRAAVSVDEHLGRVLAAETQIRWAGEMKTTLTDLEARLRDAGLVPSREVSHPNILRILADRSDADGIELYGFLAFLEQTGGNWTLTQPNSFWIRGLLDLDEVFDLIVYLHAMHCRKKVRLNLPQS
jgi:hypothetical protein